MNKLKISGILLLVYGLFCVTLGVFKFPLFWSMGNIQRFINILGGMGTQVFIIIWGLIALGFGVWLTFIKGKRPPHNNMNQRQPSAWAGILAPIIFVSVFTVEGILRSGYDPMKMYISALSLGNRGWIQISNFIVLGILLFIFTVGLSKEFQTGKASPGGIITLYIISALFFVSGPFVMDPAETPTSQMSVHGLIHEISGGIVFLLMPIIIFIFFRRFVSDAKWQSFRWWTFVLGIIEATGVIAFTYVSKVPIDQNPYINWLGLFQRIALIPFMLWVFIFGVEMLRKQN